MLSIGKLAPGQHDYYLDTVARGAEEYHTAAGEAPGYWTGRAAARIGLTGEVIADDLGAVLSDRHPDGGDRLMGGQGRAQTPGFDCTFSAPKSVSLLWALGPPEVSRQVWDARSRRPGPGGVGAGCARSTRTGSSPRRSGTGRPGPATRSFTPTCWSPTSPTSRGEDRWTALDARPLYAWAKTAGNLYEAQLRAGLTRRLGVEWEQPVRGIAELAGIPKAVLRHFSRRRQQIEAHLAEVGMASGKAAQVATYATRAAKGQSTPMVSL